MSIKTIWENVKAKIIRKEQHIGGEAVTGRIFKKIDPKEEGPPGHNVWGRGKLQLKAKITRKDGSIEEVDLA